MKNFKKILNPDKLSTLLFYICILAFILAFNFAHNPPGGWYQQFMPNIGGRQISDVFFLDSLAGWAVTPYIDLDDTAYILKTSNGGNNWNIVHTRAGSVGFSRIKFINSETGFVCGANSMFSYPGLSKSTDGGLNWILLNVPEPFAQFNDMSVLNEDTIWLSSASSGGGVFRTTNGATNWTLQYNGNNPDKIYMFNSRMGFITNSTGSYLRRTTNSGESWEVITGQNGFTDIKFIDSNTGWKSFDSVKKTTDGGTSWITQKLPAGGNIILSQIREFSIVNKDTIWGVGGHVFYPGNGNRGMIYRTSNGGNNWLYQVPDTSININTYFFCDFIDSKIGWVYHPLKGIHTTVGGDSVFYPITNINSTGLVIPADFKLHQNYPNPFNPSTSISYELSIRGEVRLIVHDITGKEIQNLVDELQTAGDYDYTFKANSLPSGVYFYSLFVDGKHMDSKKMMLVR
ncbi:MAG: T9SS type A sorting domain-containing protein [Ignavibacteria bacterium]|nr:T9SS type A sorting domain-containing protein [Ignavibacteria bacterium]